MLALRRQAIGKPLAGKVSNDCQARMAASVHDLVAHAHCGSCSSESAGYSFRHV
jgi:hypothetical protein